MVVTATVYRRSLDDALGLSLRQMGDSGIVITSKSPGGLFADSDLKVGMALRSINGLLCDENLTAKEAIGMLKTIQGDLTVTAENVGYVSAHVVKTESPSIGMGVKTRDGQLYITTIVENGLFANTDLKVGMQVVTVNKKPCAGLKLKEAVALFKNTEDQELLVLAKDPGYITVRVEKENVDAKCGIGLKEMDGNIYISYISKDGLFADTELEIGLKAVRVNNREMKGKTALEALEAFKSAPRTVTVFAERAGFYTITVVKEHEDDKVGIKLRAKGENIYVSSIAEDNVFAKTALEEGFRIISVNERPCRGLSPIEAIQFFAEAGQYVTVFAEDTTMTGLAPPPLAGF